ncbi:hypothetical protein [Nocardiopsis sp. MT53]|uniref:FCS-type domain-containing protein n=1 Tax=Nocardiopsis changdeensis TaxID=2831969 RepID=A0ABX8BW67_9ACTN|nr:hypothetical protein KGD84_32160 [Nocardiopsis changdeensis]QYX40824.1 hypothetical protein K1J57_33015 [Nocardiopsis sp. MT53]
MEHTPTADDGQAPEHRVIETVREKVIRRTCGWCGKDIAPRAHGKGRPRTYCSRSCRQRAYEVRTANERLERDRAAGTARAADDPVREVVERVVTRTTVVPVAARSAADPWTPRHLQDPEPAREGDLPRPRELQRLLARVAAAIAQGAYNPSEVDRIMRGASQVQTAGDRYVDALQERLRGGGGRNRH